MARRREPTESERAVVLSLGRRIRALREERGWAQIDLAAHLDDDIQRAMISDIETGRRTASLTTLIRIAGAFEVPVAALFLERQGRSLRAAVADRALSASEESLRPVAKLLDVEI